MAKEKSHASLRTYLISTDGFEDLILALKQEHYKILGPRVRDQAIVYDEILTSADLPIGWTDEQSPGHYRLKRLNNKSFFSYVVGPHSWKKFLQLPRERLWSMQKTSNKIKVNPERPKSPKMAFIGVRSCEIQGILVQDKVFMEGAYIDDFYANRRKNVFIVAVNCTRVASTCFCTSMNTGPKALAGFDLSLTEVLTQKQHFFIVNVGSDKGHELIQKIPHKKPQTEELDLSQKVEQNAVVQANKNTKLDTKNIKELLYNNIDHKNWEDVAKRCLSCANCTMACPTCFCSTVEDVTDLTGENVERWRRWDSCFTADHSYIHGGSVHHSTKSRYRQWMTHKLSSWIDQFGTSGCVGCGRCIAWCPVGIDIREEVEQIRQTNGDQDEN